VMNSDAERLAVGAIANRTISLRVGVIKPHHVVRKKSAGEIGFF